MTTPAPVADYDRLSQTDPTGRVDLEDPAAVETAVTAILAPRYGAAWRDGVVGAAIADLVAAFRGDYPGLLRCDMLYHDLRHALETGLAAARLIDGHARAAAGGDAPAIDADHALLAILISFFHDIGMLRRPHEAHLQGASLTPVHEERGVEFMRNYLARTPLAALADKAELLMPTKLVFRIPDGWPPLHRLLGSIIASADLLAQIADRCYLEKCRDFLFVEMSAFGLAGHPDAMYPDGETLLAKTPGFFSGLIQTRLDNEFGGVHRLMREHFGGANPYDDAIRRNIDYLNVILQDRDFDRLRRQPRPFLGDSDSGD